MAKSNPLFVDSTKLSGDSIGTQIELGQIGLYEGEELYVLITNHLGEVRHVTMNLNSELTYQTRVWLNHQKTFAYQFVIQKDGKRILQSVEKKARAQYAIVDRWEPVLAEPNPIEVEPQQAVETNTNIPDHVKSVASLIEKFGF